MIEGMSVTAKVSRVVDGDTIRVFLPGENDDESLRILSLDTEESRAGSSKPKTPWGVSAKKKAESFFSPGDDVELEFPGYESLDECMERYRGNYGRLLVYVYKNGVDFQETMIKKGYSPYFVKYGNAPFQGHHERYVRAERDAQMNHKGVWNQLEVNGSEVRNYAMLGVWWKLRAQAVEGYRAAKKLDIGLLDTRLDYGKIEDLARQQDRGAVFTELRGLIQVGSRSAIVPTGSQRQPFCLYLPDTESDAGQEIVQLMLNRYVSADGDHPRRNYAYVSGEFKLYNGKPEIVITSPDQITDDPPE